MRLFSKRARSHPSSINYNLPEELRIQIVHIWDQAFGPDSRYGGGPRKAFEEIHRVLCAEHAVFSLTDPDDQSSAREAVTNYFLNTRSVDKALDVVLIVFRTIEKMVGKTRNAWNEDIFLDSTLKSEKAVEELNERFREHSIGYRYSQGEILKIDNQYMYPEVVEPAFVLLQQPYLKFANEEFLLAHENYKHGNFSGCILECCKAFESTMKAICHKRGWHYEQHDTAKRLIEHCLSNKLLPPYMQAHFTALRTLLESGVPTVRNKTSGHGAGVVPNNPSEDLACYAMHLTAANIRLLAVCEQRLP